MPVLLSVCNGSSRFLSKLPHGLSHPQHLHRVGPLIWSLGLDRTPDPPPLESIVCFMLSMPVFLAYLFSQCRMFSLAAICLKIVLKLHCFSVPVSVSTLQMPLLYCNLILQLSNLAHCISGFYIRRCNCRNAKKSNFSELNEGFCVIPSTIQCNYLYGFYVTLDICCKRSDVTNHCIREDVHKLYANTTPFSCKAHDNLP